MTKSSSKVKVAVRVRPFNKRETDLKTICVVDMQNDQTYLTPPSALGKQVEKKHAKTFTFDHCFWSMDPNEKEKFADQEIVFKSLGMELLDNAFEGYNACIFAYGQTGSGKSYTMMGSSDQVGLIPRLCDVLFERIQSNSASQSFKVEVSYMEIYNEKVRDLLNPSKDRHHLKVREHKLLGPYVDGLQQLVASSAEEVQDLMSEGSKSRTVAATKMNAESSRSHAVFTLIVTHSISDEASQLSGERVSKLSLVDLAGSERSSKTGASGKRLKEGSNINKSLTTLGLVISALADQAAGKTKNKFVPYRDSTLTWILKDNLGGNSRTTMVATLSPSADNYEETLSTLRYADRAKRIVNKAVVNEDPNAKIIRELRVEVEKLQQQLKQSESMQATDLQEKLNESEKLIKEISLTWEEKLRKTELAHKKRQETLEKMGISLKDHGIKLEKAKCFLVNLNADPSLNELLVYYLKDSTFVGQSEDSDVQLSGLGISRSHAEISIRYDENGAVVTMTPLEGARTCVNGRLITSPTGLHHGDRILWGNNHFFRVNIPRLGKKSEEAVTGSTPVFSDKKTGSVDAAAPFNNTSYEYAQQEVLFHQVEAPIQTTIMNLEREFQLLQDEPSHIASDLNQSFGKLDEEERKKYESEIDSLKKQLTSLTPSQSLDSLNDRFDQSPKKVPISETKSPAAGYEKYKTLKEEREKTFRSSVTKLREELLRAQALIREANDIALELEKSTEFSVTLRIPAYNLTSNRKKGALLCEPAIQVVRDGKDCHIWSVEKLANRLVEMRELYQHHKQALDSSSDDTIGDSHSFSDDVRDDPFSEMEHGQLLIGVANVFLTCLVQEAPLYYPVPIINQQGQVAGKLLVGLQKISGSIPEHMLYGEFEEEDGSFEFESSVENESSCSTCSFSAESDGESESSSGESNKALDSDKQARKIDHPKALITPTTNSSLISQRKTKSKEIPQLSCRLTISEVQGLPSSLSQYVECQYKFLDFPDVIVVTPEISPDEILPQKQSTLDIRFNHSMIFTCNITEELLDSITSNASLAIEIWGHKDRYHNVEPTPYQNFSTSPGTARSQGRASRKLKNSRTRGASLLTEKILSVKERWSEVMKRLQMEVTIQELKETGEYEAVEIANKPEVLCAGIFQLKQGQSRRIKIDVSTEAHSGTLPLICQNIGAVYAGSIYADSINKDKDLDSYQDKDLNVLRKQWSRVLDKRKDHLDKQIKILAEKEEKTALEREREHRLFDQWVMLTEERNAVSAPAPSSGVPGAPASWKPPLSYEMHVPIIFLDLNSHPVDCEGVIRSPAGLDSELPSEVRESFVQLPFVRPADADHRSRVTCLASWDSSMHDSAFLNKITPSGERVYLIVKVHVRLSHPSQMDMVLRKRICVNVYKQKGIASALMRKIHGKPLTSSGVVYEIVSNVPQSFSEEEDHEALAMLAASGANVDSSSDEGSSDGEDTDGSQFEKYVMRATRSVDNILALDRVRQEVALRDALVKDPNHSGVKGSDVVSILSKRNKVKASSSSSAYPVVHRGSARTSATFSQTEISK